MYHWLINAAPLMANKASGEHLQAGQRAQIRQAGEMLHQYPYLEALEAEWLEAHDQDGISRVDEFLILHSERIDHQQAAHDLTVWLLDQVVLTCPPAHWVFHPHGTCAVAIGDVLLDPYRTVLHRMQNRKPVAEELLEYARYLITQGERR